MGFDRNSRPCPHNVTETEDGDTYCVECGDVIDFESEEDDADNLI